MGSALGRVLRDGGARVVATVAGRSERTARLADQAGLELLPALEDVARVADLVLSIGPPAEAEAIAHAIAVAGASGLYVDMNAVSPTTVQFIAAELKLDVVDASISGAPPGAAGATTRIYASGSRAPEVVALPWDDRVDVRVIGDEVGLASAVKMCTASVYKGTNALLLHALASAQWYGVLEYVLDDLGHRADDAPRRIANIVAKSARFVGEMREIASTQEDAGLAPTLFEAMAEVYSELAGTPLAQRAPEDVPRDLTLEQVLDALRQL